MEAIASKIFRSYIDWTLNLAYTDWTINLAYTDWTVNLAYTDLPLSSLICNQ